MDRPERGKPPFPPSLGSTEGSVNPHRDESDGAVKPNHDDASIDPMGTSPAYRRGPDRNNSWTNLITTADIAMEAAAPSHARSLMASACRSILPGP